MTRFTVLGAAGFIGGRTVAFLRERGLVVDAPPRDANLRGRNLGHILYCIGLTADFRMRPFDTISAHVCKLQEVLQHCEFESLVYLSSTRLYQGRTGEVDENADIQVQPTRPGDLYNISKLMGESIVLQCGRPGGRIARLSNVYGTDFRSDNFLFSVIRQALSEGEVVFETALESVKDYVHIDDVISALIYIATHGKLSLYNVASGVNVSNAEIATALSCQLGCQVRVKPGAPVSVFPLISNRRLRAEFDFLPALLPAELPRLVQAFQQQRGEWLC